MPAGPGGGGTSAVTHGEEGVKKRADSSSDCHMSRDRSSLRDGAPSVSIPGAVIQRPGCHRIDCRYRWVDCPPPSGRVHRASVRVRLEVRDRRLRLPVSRPRPDRDHLRDGGGNRRRWLPRVRGRRGAGLHRPPARPRVRRPARVDRSHAAQQRATRHRRRPAIRSARSTTGGRRAQPCPGPAASSLTRAAGAHQGRPDRLHREERRARWPASVCCTSERS